MKKQVLIGLLTSTAFLTMAGNASAVTRWSFSNGMLTDGGSILEGSYIDVDGTNPVGWEITTTAGDFVTTGYLYTFANSSLDLSSPGAFLISSTDEANNTQRNLQLVFQPNPPGLSDSVPIGTMIFAKANLSREDVSDKNDPGNGQFRTLAADMKVTAVPEPITILGSAAALGFGGLLAKEYGNLKEKSKK